MFHIKGNILWLRTVILTVPVCELSALDWIKKCFLPVVPLLCGIFKWNFTDMFHIKGYILWQRTITLTFPVQNKFWCPQQWRGILQCLRCFYSYWKNGFWPVIPLLFMIWVICPGISEYNFTDIVDLKNGFWPVVHLLYGISEWNFTDMLIIKGYILWLKIVTLTFPDCELSTLDWSENWFLACSFFYYMEYLNETSQICWTSKVTYF